MCNGLVYVQYLLYIQLLLRSLQRAFLLLLKTNDLFKEFTVQTNPCCQFILPPEIRDIEVVKIICGVAQIDMLAHWNKTAELLKIL